MRQLILLQQRKYLGRILACQVLVLSTVTGCSLSARNSSHLVISMPEGGFTASARDLAVRTSRTSNESDNGGNPAPTSLASFQCFAVMVTGEGINADPRFANCHANPSLAPRGMGVLAGLVSATGGTIDIQVPSGPSRLIQLIGLQSRFGSCPSLETVTTSIRSGDVPGVGMPFEIARITQDIYADQSIEIKAAFDPSSTPQPVFGCDGADSSPTSSDPITFANLDLFPHGLTNGSGVHVTGNVYGGSGNFLFTLYRDAACAVALPSVPSSSLGDNSFTATSMLSSVTDGSVTPIYIKATSGSTVSDCTRVGTAGFEFSSVAKNIQITTPAAGYRSDGTAPPAFQVTGVCTGSGGTITISIGALVLGTTSCATGTYSYVVTSGMIIAGIEGSQLLRARYVPSSGTPVDDGVMIWRDSFAPGLQMTAPFGAQLITASSSISASGTCGALGQLVIVKVGPLDSADSTQTTIGSFVCISGAWSGTVDVGGVPNGPLVITAVHDNGDSLHRSYAGVRVTKDSAVIDNFSHVANNPSSATAMTFDSAGNQWVVGSGKGGSGQEFWIVRERLAGLSTWFVRDAFQTYTGFDARANAVATDSLGNIYVAGYGTDAALHKHWLVRKWDAVGATWATIDDYSASGSFDSEARAIMVDGSSGAIFVAGSAVDSTGVASWEVRRFYASSWGTVDTYRLHSNHPSLATSITYGASKFVVGGTVTDSTGHSALLIRTSTNGVSWSATPVFDPYPSSTLQIGNAVAVDNNGSLLIGGTALDAGNQHAVLGAFSSSTWAIKDDYSPVSSVGSQYTASFNALYYNVAESTLYAAGVAAPGPVLKGAYWVRKYPPAGLPQISALKVVGSPVGANGLAYNSGTLYSCGSLLVQTGVSSSQNNWITKVEDSFE